MEAKNGIKNIVSGLLKQIIILLLGLILPRLILINYGSDINGFMSSVNQMVTYLALLEVGVGTATLQALYRPIVNNNKDDINCIMAATHHFYKRTGIIYGIIVIIFAFVYPLIIKTEIKSSTIISFILISGMVGVLNYLFQGKYKILLQAEGKNYIITNLGTMVNVCTNISKIILISLKINIIGLQIAFLVFNIVQMLFINNYIKKNYKWLDITVKANYDAISQSKSVMLHEISYMIFAHTDTLILTLMCDLKTVSVYSIYNMLFVQIESIINIFSSSVQFILGQVYSECIQSYKKLYDIFEFSFLIISFIIFTVTYIFLEPFIRLYTLGVLDTNYLLPGLPILFIIIKILTSIRTITNQTITVGGFFSNTKWIAISEAIINLIATIIFVKHLGIYGVLLGTIIGLTFRVIFMSIYVNYKVLDRNIFILIRRLFFNSIILFLIKLMSKAFFFEFKGYFEMLIAAAIVTVLTSVIYIVINLLIEKVILNEILDFIKYKKIKV